MGRGIKPALTPVEWEGRLVLDEQGQPVGVLVRSDEVDGDVGLWTTGERTLATGAAVVEPDGAHAIMALANATLSTEDPRRLNWAMVDAIRAAAEGAGPLREPLQAAAAAITAILPPRDRER